MGEEDVSVDIVGECLIVAVDSRQLSAVVGNAGLYHKWEVEDARSISLTVERFGVVVMTKSSQVAHKNKEALVYFYMETELTRLWQDDSASLGATRVRGIGVG